MNTFLYERTPFDILVRNFFQDASKFTPLADTKVPHPVDIYTSEKGLFFEVACTGISKKDLKIEIQDQTLRINYDKDNADSSDVIPYSDYIHKGIAKRSFNLGWRIDSKFDLSKANAEFKDGLLQIIIPFSKGSELKTLTIK